MSLTVEQMEFLQERGLSLADVIEFARLNPKAARSANAERQARFRQRQKQVAADDSVTDGVINNVTDNTTSNVIVTPLSLPPNENISNPPTHTPGNNTRTRKGTETPAKPDGVSPETWRDFLDLRKRKGSPLTETALKGISREASKAGWPLEAALEKCVVRGWQGFEVDWLKGEKPPSATPANDVDPLMRRLMARKAREAPA